MCCRGWCFLARKDFFFGAGGRSSTVSAYGAAGSIILVLLWVYYSAQILFFGAEVTKVYAKGFGRRPQPAEYARWISAVQPEPRRAEVQPKSQEPRPSRQEELVSELKREIESLREVVGR